MCIQSIKRKIGIFTYFLLTCCSFTEAQLRIENFADPIDFQVCGTTEVRADFFNTGASQVNAVEFEYQLPSGIFYVAGSVVGATEIDISNLRFPRFRINAIAGQGRQSIHLQLQSDCNTYSYADRGEILRNMLKYTANNISDSVASNPGYVMISPFLIIQDVPVIISEAGNTVTRNIEIINTKKGSLHEFIFEDHHDPNIQINADKGQVMINDDRLLRLRISEADFRQIGNRDNSFDLNEKIVITETISHDTCEPQIINSKFVVQWGCVNSICQEYVEREFIDYQKIKSEANINIKTITKPLDCVCDTNGADVEFELFNFGGKDATDIVLTINTHSIGPDPRIAAIGGSFSSEGAAKIDSIVIDSTVELKCSIIPVSDPFLFRVNISNIAAGEIFKLKYKYRTDFRNSPNADIPFNYSLAYKSKCLLSKENKKDGIGRYSFSGQARTGFSLENLETGNDWKDGEIRNVIFKIKPGEDFIDKNLFAEFQIPCGFTLLDSSFLIGNISPLAINIVRAKSTMVSLQYRNDFLINNDYSIIVPIQFDCNSACIPTDSLSATRFISSCPVKKSIASKLSATLCYSLRIPCFNQDVCCYKFETQGEPEMTLDCNDKFQKIDTIPGYVDFDSKIYRASRGRSDVDGNRFAETGPLDTSLIRNDRFITNDTMVHHFSGKIISDFQNESFDSIVFSITTVLEHDSLSGFIRYKNAMNSSWYDCRIDSLERPGGKISLPNCISPVIVEGKLGSGYILSITPDVLRAAGCPLPAGLLFGDGDSIEYILKRRIKSSVQNIFGSTIIHRVFLFNNSKLKVSRFFCGEDLFKVELTTPQLIDQRPVDELIYCNEVIQFPGPMFSGGKATNDYFMREFRNIYQPSDVLFNVPDDINLDSLVVLVFYHTNGKDSLVGYHRYLPLFQNNRYLFSLISDPNFQYDESYSWRYIPYGSFKDCARYRDSKSVQITGSYTIKSIDNKPFYSNDDLRPLLFEIKKIYTSIAQIKRPSAQLQFSTREINSSDRQLQWGAIYNNASKGFFKIRMGSSQGLMDSFKINITNGVNVREPEKNCFVIGPFEEFKDYSFQFSALNLSCFKDTLEIWASWSCDSTFLFPFIDTCFADSFRILIFNQNPKLALSAQQMAGKIFLCDTLPEYVLRFYNADRGTAYNLQLELDIPEGVMLIPQSILYSYPPGSPFQPLPLPQFKAGRTYVWEMDKLIPDIANQGLPGFQDSSRYVTIRYKAITDCNSKVNGFFEYRLCGENNCKVKVSPQSALSPRIIVEGLQEQSNYMLSVKEINPSPCNDNSTIEVLVRRDQMTLQGDSISLFLPYPMQYIDQSFVPLSNISGPPFIINQGNDQKFSIAIPGNLASNSEIRFRLRISNQGSLCVENLIKAETFSRRGVFCKTINDSCDVLIQTSEANLFINKKLPSLNLDSFDFAKTSGPQNIKGLIHLGIQDKEFAGVDSLCIDILQDKFPIGSIGTEDQFLKTLCIAFRDLQHNGKLIIPFEIFSNDWLGCSFAAVIGAGSCLCKLDTMYGNFLYRGNQVQSDSACLELNTLMGVQAKNGARYKWEPPIVQCDTCSRNSFNFKNSSDTTEIFNVCLIEYSDSSCHEKYNYFVTVFPPADPVKMIIRDCPDELIRLDAGDKKSILWKDGVNTSFARQIELKMDIQKTILLCYTDDRNCRVSDTFCLVPFDQLINVAINQDTSIALGDTATLYVSGGFSYLWNANEALLCDTCSVIKVSPAETSNYTVSVTDTNGCKIILTTTVRLIFPDCDSSKVFLPNAFSPNNDGVNDALFVRGNFIDRIYLVIYNRWGEKVFETRNIADGWEGIYKGELLGPDVFGYYLEVDCIGGESFRKKGNINLLK